MKRKIERFLPSFLVLFSVVLLWSSCSVNQRLKREFKHSKTVARYFNGFALYDLKEKKLVFEKNAHLYFTPASNTKLFTLYAGLKMAPDSISGLRYVERGDSLIFWGTGDPSFLFRDLKGSRGYDFLKKSDKRLFFASGRYTGNPYGRGWQWDDYNEYYQPEITEFPVMGNVLYAEAAGGKLKLEPTYFKWNLVPAPTAGTGNYKLLRDFDQNLFRETGGTISEGYRQNIPYKTSPGLTLSILKDTLGKEVTLISEKMPITAKRLFSLPSDTLFRQMMLPSDNFVAEHLLLTYADMEGLEMNTAKVIAFVQQKYLTSLPDRPQWVDGSGLSRGNLFTPRSQVALLQLIYEEVKNEERLFSLFPAGGKSGTLRNTYPKTAAPFVFAKTGSLSNNHNQSGYVRTKSGKIFCFSFMNNNFVLPTAEVRTEMVRLMTYIHEKL